MKRGFLNKQHASIKESKVDAPAAPSTTAAAEEAADPLARRSFLIKQLAGNMEMPVTKILLKHHPEYWINRAGPLPATVTNGTVADPPIPEASHELIMKRSEDMTKVLNSWERQPQVAIPIELPATAQLRDEVQTSETALHAVLLQLFRQLQGMATEQRYFFANQAKIMMEDYDTFVKAAVLYEAEISAAFSKTMEEFAAESLRVEAYSIDAGSQISENVVRKAKASILNTFGFFLGLNTRRTFWRAMELTAGAFVMHLEKYDEVADGKVVLTVKVKASLLQCLAELFWALHHAQYELDRLRELQLERYKEGVFPFYPVQQEALEAGVDVHLIIAQLSKASLQDFPLVSSLLSAFKEASHFQKQMQAVSVEVMAAIDELSTRFRVMEVLLLAARLVASEDDIKGALGTCKFDSDGEELRSKLNDFIGMLVYGHLREPKQTPPSSRLNYMRVKKVSSVPPRLPTPKNASFLQKLLIKENSIRRKNAQCFMRPSWRPLRDAIMSWDNMMCHDNDGELGVDDDKYEELVVTLDKLLDGAFTADMFATFKATYSRLFQESIRRQFEDEEYSWLPLEFARRFQHRREVAKKKKQSTVKVKDSADVAAGRSVPESAHVHSSLFWEVGDGSLEKYVPASVREKIKTRKLQVDEGLQASVVSSSEILAPPVETPPPAQRSLDQLRESDFVTRDILFRKVKGSLKWSNLVQLLTRLGCSILNLDGSKRKVVDPHTGRCAVLHMPHPGDECRPDQRDSYRLHIEDWLRMDYNQLVPARKVKQVPSILENQ